MELDRERANPVYGNSRARWSQDGHYFTGDGRLLTPDEAAEPDEVEPPPPPPSDELPAYHVVNADSTGSIEIIADPVAEIRLKTKIADMEARDAERRTALNALRNDELWAAVEAAGGTPHRGPHHRNRNIRWLMENTR